MIDLTETHRNTAIRNAIREDVLYHRERYKTLGGYHRSAVKRLAFYEITIEDLREHVKI